MSGLLVRGQIVANPLTAVEVRRYAWILRGLLRALDREIVDTALIGEGEGDSGLALLDAFEGELESGEHGSPLTVSAPTVGDSSTG